MSCLRGVSVQHSAKSLVSVARIKQSTYVQAVSAAHLTLLSMNMPQHNIALIPHTCLQFFPAITKTALFEVRHVNV